MHTPFLGAPGITKHFGRVSCDGGVVDVNQRSVTCQVPQSSESTSSVVVREVPTVVLGGASVFCSSTSHVVRGNQLHMYVYTVPRDEKK